MRVSNAILARNSEQEYAQQLHLFADSGAGVIHVRTNEIVRSVLATRQAILAEQGNQLIEWNIVNGFQTIEIANMFSINADEGEKVIDPGQVIARPMSRVKDTVEGFIYYVLVNFHPWIESPVVTHFIQTYSHVLPATSVRLVLITPDRPMPEVVADNVMSVPFHPPGHEELKASFNLILQSVQDEDIVEVNEEDIDKICFAGAGMSKESFDMYSSLAIVEASTEDKVRQDDIVKGISRGKTDIVNKNDLLELYPIENIDNVGGMDNLKTWVRKRQDCYTDEAADAGIEPPKGMVFVGPPGTGKSLAAKAVAGVLGVPLVRFDFGRVFNSLVGASEERMRTALSMVQSMAPCVLFCDEIDKGLGGIGGSGDSGTSNRVLGTFLTWLQDNETPVFTMVTANNITALPPELMRRGRFDAIFSSSLPDDVERREILRIHLHKRGKDIHDFAAKGIDAVVKASNGYVGAEIESAVKDGLIDAFSDKKDFSMAYVEKALKDMVPLSKSYSKEISAMTAWAHANATPASVSEAKPKGATTPTKRSVRSRRAHTTH
jgi:ATP-dependent 26S proteasome regulatory subunit